MKRLMLAALLLLLLPPAARAEFEGNNTPSAAEGPLAAGTVYSGMGNGPNPGDEDWSTFFVKGHVTLTVTLASPSDNMCSNSISLIGANGGNALRQATAPINGSGSLSYETPAGTNRYYLQVIPGCVNGRYAFGIDTNPAGAVVPGEQPVATDVVNTEPNEDPATAFGPMSPFSVYGGTIDTSTDQDWFFFYTSGATPFDVALLNPGNAPCTATARLYQDGSPTPLAELQAAVGTRAHAPYTPSGPARFLIGVTAGCGPANYQLVVTPPEAIASRLPPTAACLNARAAAKKLAAKQKAQTRTRKHTKGKLQRYKLKVQIKSTHRKLQKARGAAQANCA
jgi:hypothetical protein